MSVEQLSKTKSAYDKALEEIQSEKLARGVEKMKVKLRELDKAKTVVANLEREVSDLKQEIEQGNV